MRCQTADICILNPGQGISRGGNRVTALRWAKILRSLGRRPRIMPSWREGNCRIAVLLHATKSRDSLRRLLSLRPRPKILIALTGTDLYGDGESSSTDPELHSTLAQADRILVLQALAKDALPQALQERTRVLYQSLPQVGAPKPPDSSGFPVVLLAGVRPAKDPLLAARAVA